jgi:formate-dependent nitrite reductase membrane component NrfD
LVFGVVSLLSFLDNLVADGYLKSAPFRELYNRVPRKLYALVGSAAGFFIAGYTGVLLNITVRPFWVATDPWIGALFIASAASTGAAAIYLVMAVRKVLHQFELAEFERFDRYAMIFELALIAIMLIAAGQFAQPLFSGGLGVLFWVGTVGLGLLVPLGLELYTRRQGRRLHHSASLVTVVAVLVLLGGALLRITLVQAGQV